MKRITLVISDDLNTLIQQERRRRNVSAAAVVREALGEYFHESTPRRRPSFIGLGASGFTDTSKRFDEILAQEWGRADDR
jgi:hypothetical protein